MNCIRKPTRINFNPRTPRGVRHAHYAYNIIVRRISIHAPREGCDSSRAELQQIPQHFNPRTPRGVRRGAFGPGILDRDFNPRTPRGVRQVPQHHVLELSEFQSTHPARGATSAVVSFSASNTPFQSTHPARGATANFTKEQRVCLAQFAYLHKGKKAEHTKTNAPMLH